MFGLNTPHAETSYEIFCSVSANNSVLPLASSQRSVFVEVSWNCGFAHDLG